MRLLMTTDGSTQSEIALRFGTQFAHSAEEPVTILTVIKHVADRPKADAILARSRELLESEGISHHTKVRIGHPAEEIIREAEENNCNLLVLGEGQHRALVTRFLLGSTAVRVAEHAPCPVLIVKGKGNQIRRILLCDSGAENSSVLSRFTAQLADLLDGEETITVLHVMSQISAAPGVSGKQLRANAKDLIIEHSPEGKFLEQNIKVLGQSGIHPNPLVRHGLVIDEILDEARSGSYDLVVIGAHKNEGWQHILLDDLAKKIMTRSEWPVLVVR